LGPTFGRGAMTNHWNDLANSDCLMIIGCNPAENHPISFKWITKAQERGAKLIVVDPRFTRSAAKADLYVRLRPGTDIALMGGLINYILENNLFHKDYVVNYTDAAFLVNKDFAFHDGLFSGYQKEKHAYDTATWDYVTDGEGKPATDPSLNSPNCVFQLLKAHFARYTPGMVEAATGVPREQFLRLAATYTATGQPGKSGALLYAMGGTQHSTGVQIIRSYCILQLLLGNMGISGGGINALRGENNVQGSTDMGLLFNLLPGYLGAPMEAAHPTLKDYLDKETPKAGFWINKPKFLVSLLKAYWGEAAQKANDFAYDYFPKAGKGFQGAGYSWIPLFEAMGAGTIKGLLCWGMNPAVSSANLNQTYQALARLEWLAAFDLWETDTSVFWKRPGVDPKTVKTEVFLFPAVDALEKEGGVTNSSRWIQWRYQAVKPRGDGYSDLWYANRLGLELKKLYQEDPKAAFPDPIVKLNWGYGDDPDVHLVAKEINGYTVADKKQVPNFLGLKDDGATACGCWIFSGFYPGPDKKDNKAAARVPKDPSGLGLYPGWSFAWPVNRRILYNRCSADPQGQPWRIWHPMIMWNPHSVLFEVSWCVMLYTTVLAIDLFIIGLERYGQESWIKFFRQIYLFLVVAAVMLSTLHQSSLGALFLLMPQKMSDLWATQAIGPLFFASAVIGGMSVITLESLIASRVYRRPPEIGILSDLGKGLGIALLIYFAMKVTDLYARGAAVWVWDKPHFFFFVEIFGTVALPALLLSFPEMRRSEKGLYWTSGLAAFGVVLNRFNVSLTGYIGYRQFGYFPSAVEIIITAALVAMAILIFDLGMRYLPIHPVGEGALGKEAGGSP